MKTFVRIAVRENGDLILGKNFGTLKGGKVYEIVDSMGLGDPADFFVREVGNSCINGCLSQRTGGPGLSWAFTAERILCEGTHLYTMEEYNKLCAQEQE